MPSCGWWWALAPRRCRPSSPRRVGAPANMRSPVNVAPATTTLLRNEFFECPIAVRSPFNDLDEWRRLRGELHATRSRTDVESIHAATCGGCPEVLPRQIITHASIHGAVALR